MVDISITFLLSNLFLIILNHLFSVKQDNFFKFYPKRLVIEKIDRLAVLKIWLFI